MSSYSSSSKNMNKYWIPNKDIHKKVIISELPYLLGPEATVRNYTNNGEDGFLITTPGECLTDAQIDDICNKSKEMWDRQAASRAGNSPNKLERLKRPWHVPVTISKAGSSGSNVMSGGIRRSYSHRSHYDHRGYDKGKDRAYY